MTKEKEYEYKTEIKDFFEFQSSDQIISYLNKEGKDGWDLVKMDEDDEVNRTFWFKRLSIRND